MAVGSIHRDGHGPNGNGDGGLCRCGPWCTPPPSPPCSPSTYHPPIPPIPSLGAHGHHAIWLMTANGPPPISVIQTSGSSSAMACIRPYPSVHHPLRIPTPWRWGAYGGRAMVLMVLGMEGHTLPWPTPPPAPPLRMEVATTTPLRTIPSSLCASPWHHGGQHHNGPTPILVIQTSGSSSAMAWIHPYPSVHHPSVHPYAMAVGSIRREGHGANGTRDGGPYTTMAYTTTSTTTTYGGGHHHATTDHPVIPVCIPVASRWPTP